jgi:hypothetical protein
VLVESTTSPQAPLTEEGSDGQEVLTAASKVAFDVAEDFLSWLRVLAGQFWIGASHEPPSLAGAASLDDVETGEPVRNIGLELSFVVRGLSEAQALEQRGLDEIATRLANEERAPEAGTLLADAQATITGPGAESSRAASRRDTRRAVLLAAIASEIKIKETLRKKTSTEKRDLVDVLINSWREVDTVTAGLTDKAMRAAVGHSLREDNKSLYKAVVKLFELRNQIAHRGKEPTISEAQIAVAAAVDLSKWLDALAQAL